MNLVVGATGNVGGAVCDALRAEGKPVRAVVRESSDPERVRWLEGLGAGLVHGELRDPESLATMARAQTALTHGDPQVIDAAEFFARAALSVAEGAGFEEAFDEAASHPYDALPAIDWVTLGRDAAAGDFAAQAGALGLGCGIGGAFPITLAVAFRHESDPVAALSAFRGDSAGGVDASGVASRGGSRSWREAREEDCGGSRRSVVVDREDSALASTSAAKPFGCDGASGVESRGGSDRAGEGA